MKFIVDAPSPQDDLGPHARVAQAIADVVRSDRKRIKMVGVLGGWGSGKSTVVKLVQDRLETDQPGEDKIRCYSYDAWRHQSDPHRRSFLEDLARYLETTPVFEDLAAKDPETPDRGPVWRARLDALRHQTETNTTTTTPTLTKGGGWYLASLVLVPIGIRLIGDGTLASEDQQDLAAIAMFTAGWLMTAAPFIVALFVWASWRRWKLAGKAPEILASRTFWFRNGARRRKASVVAIIANKQVESREELKRKSPEPTAIEFQDSFRDMVGAAQVGGRRLVIVVDNLDRLPPEASKAIWATIRGLFLGSDGGHRAVSAEDLPTVIIPIDETSVGRMYGVEEEPLSRSFIEKTFDLVFHVPAPVLSTWHRYLATQLKAVFEGELCKDGPHIVGAFFERQLGGLPAAPRTINAFVNALGVLWIQRSDDPIHIGIIAFFITHRDALAKNLHETLVEEQDLLEPLDKNWRIAVAALHYGVDRQTAEELFMDDPIRTAINARDEIRFKELAAVPGFDRYFLHVLENPLKDDTRISAMSAASLFALCDRDQPWMEVAWKRLRKLSLEVSALTVFAIEDADAFASLAGSCDTAEKPLYLKAMGVALQYADAGSIDRDGGLAYAAIARRVVELANEAGLADFRITVPGGAARYASMLVQGLSPQTMAALEPGDGSLSGVVLHLAQRFNGETSYKTVADAVEALAARGGDQPDWTPFTDLARDMLQSGDAERAAAAVDIVRRLYNSAERVRDVVAIWRDQGVLGGAWSVLWQSETELAGLANLAAILLKVDGGLDPADGRTWEDRIVSAPELPTLIDDALVQLGQPRGLDWLLARLSRGRSDAALLRALAARSGLEAPTYTTLFENTAGYTDLMPFEARGDFWSAASDQAGFWSALENLSPSGQRPVLHALVRGQPKSRSSLGKALSHHFAQVTEDEWAEALGGGRDPMTLVLALDDLPRTSVTLPVGAFNALKRAIPAVVVTEDEAVRTRWFQLAHRLAPANRETLFKALAEGLTASGSVPSLIRNMVLGGDDLLEHGGFEDSADRSVIQIVMSIAERDDGRRWLHMNSARLRPWIEGSRAGTRSTLTAQLTAHRDAGDEFAAPLLQVWGLEED